MLRIRLRRVGAKKHPSYRIVVADSRFPRNGIYVMPELQMTFDNETNEDSFWFAPEIGKVFPPSQPDGASFVVYAKPGYGINNERLSFEREWSFEIGVRWMWNQFPLF